MYIRRIVEGCETAVDGIIQRQLCQVGYRVMPKVRLQDAIGKGVGDWLSDREFSYFTRAHLDFLVTENSLPIFAVEFDGPFHKVDAVTCERDLMKNRLCKLANLPLLRISASEIAEHDHMTVLVYMLMRFAAWQKEYPAISAEIQDFALSIPADADVQEFAVDLDPSVSFDLKHPYPARASVLNRLWSTFRIAWAGGPYDRLQTANFCFEVALTSHGCVHTDQLHTSIQRAILWPRSGTRNAPIAVETVEANMQAWLPLRADIPEPSGEICQTKSGRRMDWLEGMRIRMESMWFPYFPGTAPWDIADNYSEYLGFRAIERWAQMNLAYT